GEPPGASARRGEGAAAPPAGPCRRAPPARPSVRIPLMAARITAYIVAAIVSITFIAGLIVGAQRDENGPVDLIVLNGRVYTADEDGSFAEAVAIQGNRILRVGTTRDISRLKRAQTVVVDAKGGAVLPGFNDAHAHLLEGGRALAGVDLSRLSTLD